MSEGKKWTPKHIGLASTLHLLTRSKHLVELFNPTGHILSYKQVLKIDTALAEHTLQSMNKENGAVFPPNLSSNTFTHYTADNIDINDSTLDGKNTFHATQVAAWQRGPAPDAQLSQLKPWSNVTLKIPEVMEKLIPASISEGKTYPVFSECVDIAWYTVKADESDIAQQARAIDMSFIVKRQNKQYVLAGQFLISL